MPAIGSSGYVERIYLIVESLFKRQGLDAATRQHQRFGDNLKRIASETNLPLTRMVSQLEGINVGVNKQGQLYDMLTGRIVRNKDVVNKLTAANKRFKMEMLGVMFFGMSISALMTGLVAPAMQLVGIFDLLNTVLAIAFLPTAISMIDPMLALLNFFIALPDPIKSVMGAFVLFIGAIGLGLFTIGQMNLGLTSTLQAWNGIKAAGGLRTLTVKYAQKGWTALKDSLASIAAVASKAGKTLKSIIKTSMDPTAWKAFLLKKSVLDKLRKGVTVMVTVFAIWGGWKIGQAIAGETYESVGRGFMEAMQDIPLAGRVALMGPMGLLTEPDVGSAFQGRMTRIENMIINIGSENENGPFLESRLENGVVSGLNSSTRG
jgi:hypothetical protein